jgi:hypothetical protein
MEQHQEPVAPAYLEMVSKLNQGIFYCYNESSVRLPVSMVRDLKFKDEKTLCFSVTYFPLTEQVWNVFASELHLYKKGISYSVILTGVSVVNSLEKNLVEFNIQHAEYFEQGEIEDNGFLNSLFKPYIYFYRKSSEFLSSAFNKKNITNALHKFYVHSNG